MSGERSTGWVHRELSGEGSPARSNAQLRRLIEHGAAAVDVIGDAPTMALLDPDHPYSRHSAGTNGVSLCRAADFDELYAGIPLGDVSVSQSLPPAVGVAGLYLAGRNRGVDPARLRGSVINPPFFAEDYAYATHLPFELRMRLSLDAIEFATRHMPRFHPFVEDTYFISDGGIGPVDEMAFGFVEIREVVRRLLARGLPIDSFARRIVILVNCRMELLTEIAKIRATRRIFARMMREEFGATDPRSWNGHVTVHTSGASLTAQQPVNNVVRGAVQALAMALAGVKAMEVSAFDEALRTPSDAAHRVALRTQQIVALETDVLEAADPLAGSAHLEHLTDTVEEAILARVKEIEALGDPGTLSEQGWFRRVFEEEMVQRSREVADGSRPVVGVNCFTVPDADDTLLRDEVEAKIEPCVEHIDAVRRWKEARPPAPLAAALARVEADGADPGVNLVDTFVAALAAGATVGEITGALRLAAGLPADPYAVRLRA
jgi:methylmalonyl-CoA mutase N-terminal domain/subunit